MTVGGARAYWVAARGRGELRTETLAGTESGRSLVEARWTGVSAGTERLVGLGRVPASCAARMACRGMAGSFGLPVKYGYSFVGVGIEGAWTGRRVFAMHPHQERAWIEDPVALPLPDEVPDRRACLVPNLETALNAVWDAECTAADRVVVVGAGAVGLLVAYALHRTTGLVADVVEVDGARRELAAGLPWVGRVLPPGGGERESRSVAFHTSGTGPGLQTALDLVGFEGRVVELSWFGTEPVTVDLGGGFHALRKRIVASQVGAVAPVRRGGLDGRGRLREVLDLLDEPGLDGLLGEPVAFDVMPAFMAGLYRGAPTAPLPVIRYRGSSRPCSPSPSPTT